MPNFDFSFQTACLRKTHATLLVICFDQAHFVDLNSRTIKMTLISKLGRPYENGKHKTSVNPESVVITDQIDGMSAKAVGRSINLTQKLPRKSNTDTNKTEPFSWKQKIYHRKSKET